MSQTPLDFSAANNGICLCLRYGPYAGKTFSVEVHGCVDPLCRCAELTFTCVPQHSESCATGVPFEFSLDLRERRIKEAQGRKETPESLKLAEDLMAEMEPLDWHNLYQMFYLFKRTLTEKTDCTGLEVDFPPNVMDDPTTMVAFKEIFPWADTFDFVVGEARWMIDDQYCVNPGCTCKDAMIEFLRLTISADCIARVAQQTPAAVLDGRTGAFRPMHPPWTADPALDTLAQALLDAHPDVVRTLRKRRERLRLLFRNAAKAAAREAAPARIVAPKCLPNSPCPCGSGKKFKKCCGARL